MSSVEATAGDEAVQRLLAGDVPPTGTVRWREWQEQVKRFGPEAASVLLRALESGSEGEQYAALLALRILGADAHGEGYGSELVYKVRRAGETRWTTIIPRIRPRDNNLPHPD